MYFEIQRISLSISVMGNILEGNIFRLQKNLLSPIGTVKKDCSSYGSAQNHVEGSEEAKRVSSVGKELHDGGVLV